MPSLMLLYLIVGLVPSYAAVSYYLTMMAARWVGACHQHAPSSTTRQQFVILIPAPNEADGLLATLRSCRQLDYPPQQYQVIVIADNCQDATAQVARSEGVTCWERHVPEQAGKGQAIAWALERLQHEPYDACLVLDADCRLTPSSLAIADYYLTRGDAVLQLNHCVTNPDDSSISYAAAVGRTLEYDFFFAPKSRLRLAVMLVGTGMIFRRELLERVPWRATSCAEDTEYTARLAENRQRVRFISNAHVLISAASSLEELLVQRRRWAAGNIAMGRRRILPLLARAVSQRNLLLADFAVTLLLQSRPLVLAHLLTVEILGACFWLPGMVPSEYRDQVTSLQTAMLVLPLLYLLYITGGILGVGLTWRRCRLLLTTPRVVLQLMRIALLAIFAASPTRWERTPRPS
jgi:cellulose synthase/poly-beta-1,6-N-acetylglucosamine synthase-like glycosyltransferase